eukprot:364821-Chlamydomonas_euryale.AAC.13
MRLGVRLAVVPQEGSREELDGKAVSSELRSSQLNCATGGTTMNGCLFATLTTTQDHQASESGPWGSIMGIDHGGDIIKQGLPQMGGGHGSYNVFIAVRATQREWLQPSESFTVKACIEVNVRFCVGAAGSDPDWVWLCCAACTCGISAHMCVG